MVRNDRPRGLMVKALDYGAKGRGFEPWRNLYQNLFFFFLLSKDLQILLSTR